MSSALSIKANYGSWKVPELTWQDIQFWMKTFFSYTPLRYLGKGSYGTVIEVEDDHGDHLAVKMYTIVEDGRDIHMLGSFSEMYYSTLFQHHPNFVRIIDFRLVLPYAFLVMELAENTLANKIVEGIPDFIKARYAYEMANGIHYMHQAGFCHCDIKLDNFLVKRGRPLISDLGLVRIAENNENVVQQEKVFCQTTSVASPEQYHFRYRPILGYEPIADAHRQWRMNDIAADVWGLGISLLSLVYNSPFITHRSETFYQEFLEKMIEYYTQGKSVYECIQDVFGKIDDPVINPLLVEICEHLLQIEPAKRRLDLFLASAPKNIEHVLYSGNFSFDFPNASPFFKGDASFYPLAQYYVDEIHRLGDVFSLPLVVVMNAIDYVLQNFYSYSTEQERFMGHIVSLWIMERLYNPRLALITARDYLVYTKNPYTVHDFHALAIQMIGDGKFRFDSLYFQLPTMNLVYEALQEIKSDVTIYLRFPSVYIYSQDLIRIHGREGEPKSNSF